MARQVKLHSRSRSSILVESKYISCQKNLKKPDLYLVRRQVDSSWENYRRSKRSRNFARRLPHGFSALSCVWGGRPLKYTVHRGGRGGGVGSGARRGVKQFR